MLLNAEKLAGIEGASYLFVTCGTAAFFGILWRFFYNQTFHNNAHEEQGFSHQVACLVQIVCYWLYIALSIGSFMWALFAGFTYLKKVDSASKQAIQQHVAPTGEKSPSVEQSSNSTQLEKRAEAQSHQGLIGKKNASKPKT